MYVIQNYIQSRSNKSAIQTNKRKYYMYHSLKTRMQLHQEGRLARECEYTFLDHCAFHIVVLDNNVLLQDFNGVQLISSLSLRQQDLELIDSVEMQPIAG